MPCEHYKDALIEAAATGVLPQGELRVHLASCASCRAAFAKEQSLFAAIDSGLHTAANAEVPPSLLPRVRVAIDEAAMSRLRWVQPLIFASAGVAFAFLFFLVTRPHRPVSDDQARQIPVVPAPVTAAPDTRSENSLSPNQIAATHATQFRSGRDSTLFHPSASSNPEVLVPPDEREALARFVATLNGRSDVAAAVLAPAPEKKNTLVIVDPLHIADMEIKPLEGGESQTSDGAGEKR